MEILEWSPLLEEAVVLTDLCFLHILACRRFRGTAWGYIELSYRCGTAQKLWTHETAIIICKFLITSLTSSFLWTLQITAVPECQKGRHADIFRAQHFHLEAKCKWQLLPSLVTWVWSLGHNDVRTEPTPVSCACASPTLNKQTNKQMYFAKLDLLEEGSLLGFTCCQMINFNVSFLSLSCHQKFSG